MAVLATYLRAGDDLDLVLVLRDALVAQVDADLGHLQQLHNLQPWPGRKEDTSCQDWHGGGRPASKSVICKVTDVVEVSDC